MSSHSPYPDKLLTAQQTADRLGLRRKTLYNWASLWALEHRGPEPLRLGGRCLRYRESDVAAFIASLEQVA